jgi:hypothetical protein
VRDSPQEKFFCRDDFSRRGVDGGRPTTDGATGIRPPDLWNVRRRRADDESRDTSRATVVDEELFCIRAI